MKRPRFVSSHLFAVMVTISLAAATATRLAATENTPHAPFAQWADVLNDGQLQVGVWYEESESYYIYANPSTRYNVDWQTKGEHYGIDINQGYVTFQYGLTEKWTADLALGYTTCGWRYFSNDSPNGSPQSTGGIMDIPFGVRYQVWKEGDTNAPAWAPTFTVRAGAVLPGSYNQYFPYAPGNKSTAIEPEILLRKHFGWEGLGGYFDGLFIWNHTSANDEYILSTGLFQKIQRWELDVGYRYLGAVDGDGVVFDPNTRYIDYPRAPMESNSSIEAGFNYTTEKRHITWGFYTRTVFDGANSDKKFWLGAYVQIPFDLVKAK
jgi:hypothetical protein